MGRPGEALVAAAAGTAAGDHRPLTAENEVVAGAVGLDQHLGAGRHLDLERLAVPAVAQRTLAVAAAPGLEVREAAEALEVAQRVVADEHDVAAAPAVAAVWAALGDVGLAAEAEAAVAAGAGRNVDARTILHASIVSAAAHRPCLAPDLRPRTSSMTAPDPVFLITGASSGIGEATARQASEAGYRLVLSARSTDRLEQLASELGGPERAIAVTCDVTEFEQQEALVRGALQHFGQIDVAFANAGFGAKRGFLSETPEFWKSMVLTNVYGAALTIRATMPALKESRGHLLLTGSVAGRRALPGSLYSATKWAVTAMGESARQEFNDTGVRVTLIEPGMVDTRFFDDGAPPDALQADDVARAVMFAVSQPPHVDVNEILVRPTAQS